MLFTTDLIQPFEIKNYHTTDDIKDDDYREELINTINSIFDEVCMIIWIVMIITEETNIRAN